MGERIADVPELQIVERAQPGRGGGRHIPGAVNIPVGQLPDRTGELDPAHADRRVLRRWLPLVGRREPAAPARFPPESVMSGGYGAGQEPSRTA